MHGKPVGTIPVPVPYYSCTSRSTVANRGHEQSAKCANCAESLRSPRVGTLLRAVGKVRSKLRKKFAKPEGRHTTVRDTLECARL